MSRHDRDEPSGDGRQRFRNTYVARTSAIKQELKHTGKRIQDVLLNKNGKYARYTWSRMNNGLSVELANYEMLAEQLSSSPCKCKTVFSISVR